MTSDHASPRRPAIIRTVPGRRSRTRGPDPHDAIERRRRRQRRLVGPGNGRVAAWLTLSLLALTGFWLVSLTLR